MAATFSRQEILEATQAKLFQPGADFRAAGICSDSRQLAANQVFLPIVGEHFNGHDFLPQLMEQGIAGCFVQADHQSTIPDSLTNVFIVPDTVLAYLALGRWHRRRINPTVIGITGSSGKTTTKELFFSAFSGIRTSQCTQKNFNNDFGVSQTLLTIKPSTQLAIVEMAMRGSGEIARLTQAAQPDVAVITNVGPAHIERLGSLDAIAQAKCEIVQGMDPANGVVVVNGDDDLLCKTLATVWQGQTVAFLLSQASHIHPTAEGGVSFETRNRTIKLTVPGKHMVSNALSALAVAEVLGFDRDAVIAGLQSYQPKGGRWEQQALPSFNNAWVIQDAYNANPDSMKASLQAFLELETPTLAKGLILGGMNELGDFSGQYHQELGQWLAQQSGLAWLLLIGPDTKITAEVVQSAAYPTYWVANTDLAREWFWRQSLANTLVLLKGSRGYQLEQILQPLITAV